MVIFNDFISTFSVGTSIFASRPLWPSTPGFPSIPGRPSSPVGPCWPTGPCWQEQQLLKDGLEFVLGEICGYWSTSGEELGIERKMKRYLKNLEFEVHCTNV